MYSPHSKFLSCVGCFHTKKYQKLISIVLHYIRNLVLSEGVTFNRNHPNIHVGGVQLIVTQMGLDYMKHKETSRHNLATEAVDARNATSNERNASSNELNAQSNASNAKTNAYVASFKPREVAASEKQAQAAQSQASTAAGKLALEERFKGREIAAKEKQAEGTYQRALAQQAAVRVDEAYKQGLITDKERNRLGNISKLVYAYNDNDLSWWEQLITTPLDVFLNTLTDIF